MTGKRGVTASDRRQNAGRDPSRWQSNLPRIACTVSTGVLAATIGPTAAPPAAAAPQDGWADGPPDSGYRPDTSNHTYCWGADFTWQQARDASISAGNNLESQTAMTAQKVDCSGATDAVWNRTFNSGIDGFYRCDAFNSAGECETATVALNFGNMSSGNDWKQSACHELGHSVGLTHKVKSCLDTDPNILQYAPHHVDHVNCKCDNP
jgi:hypothetical protein